MDTITKITKARIAMLQDNRFWGKLALDLELREALGLDTLATDGRHIFYNPEYVDGLTMPQLKGVIAHEVCHVSNLHHTRRRGRDAELWNIAADYAINPTLVDNGFELPEGALIEPAFKDMAAEQIYRILDQKRQEQQQGGQGQGTGGGQGQPQPPQQGQGNQPGQNPSNQMGPDGNGIPGGDPGKCGQILDAINEDGSAPSPADLSQIEADQQVKVAQAVNLAKQAGHGKTDQERLLEKLKQSHQDWREELRRFVTRHAKSDSTWARPNRRFIGQGIYLPSLYSEELGEMVLAIDLSGSVADWVTDFCSELAAIKEEVKPKKLTVIYFSDGITGIDEFEADDELVIKPRGGGGTDVRPVFKHVENLDYPPECMLVLTDLETPFPDKAPDFPVLWCSTTQQKAPWGERVELRR